MTLPKLNNDRFIPEEGLRITIQVPDTHTQRIVDAVLTENTLKYGDYDSVTYQTMPGTQQFRSLGSGRNAATEKVVEVPCVELSFFLSGDEAKAVQVLKTIYASHPYEEPVIFVTPVQKLPSMHSTAFGNLGSYSTFAVHRPKDRFTRKDQAYYPKRRSMWP